MIIIGTGAGGGTLAHRPAPSGKNVLLLERGDYLPRERDAHQAGTVRFGTDPGSSALDVNCRAHDNLYVVDTSFFPSFGAVNRRSPRSPTPCGSATTSPSGCADQRV